MKMKRITLVCLVCLIACMSATTVQAQNPTLLCSGFETDDFAEVWLNYYGDLVSAVSDDHYSGTKSCKLITDAVQATEVYQTVEITAGKAYTLSVYNKLLNNGGNGAAMLGYAFLDESGSNMTEFVSVPMTSTQSTWVKGSLTTDIAPAGAVYMWFDIQSNGAAGTSILFDDASLTEAGATGLLDVHNNTSLNIMGNPVQGSLAKVNFTQASEGAELRVTDLTGKTLIQQAIAQGSTSATLSVANLSKGIYLVKYTDNAGKRATVKMIK